MAWDRRCATRWPGERRARASRGAMLWGDAARRRISGDGSPRPARGLCALLRPVLRRAGVRGVVGLRDRQAGGPALSAPRGELSLRDPPPAPPARLLGLRGLRLLRSRPA